MTHPGERLHNPNLPDQEIREKLEASYATFPDLRCAEETHRLEKELRGRIDNKDYRVYGVTFKGGSRRTLMPAHHIRLSSILTLRIRLRVTILRGMGSGRWLRGSRKLVVILTTIL